METHHKESFTFKAETEIFMGGVRAEERIPWGAGECGDIREFTPETRLVLLLRHVLWLPHRPEAQKRFTIALLPFAKKGQAMGNLIGRAPRPKSPLTQLHHILTPLKRAQRRHARIIRTHDEILHRLHHRRMREPLASLIMITNIDDPSLERSATIAHLKKFNLPKGLERLWSKKHRMNMEELNFDLVSLIVNFMKLLFQSIYGTQDIICGKILMISHNNKIMNFDPLKITVHIKKS